jgi:hypothetical protein
MSYQALNWAWQIDLGVRKTTAKLVLLALSDMADENHSCFPGQERLATMTSSSTDAVSRALKSLEEEALIERVRRHRSDGYRTSDRYFLHVGAQPASSYLGSEGAPTPHQHATYPARTPDLTPHEPGGNHKKNHQKNHQGEPLNKRPTIEAHFEKFWTVFPRRKGKGEALAAFKRAVARKGVDPEAILAGAERYANDPNLPEPAFIPHPATWLNQSRWDDDPEAPRAIGGPPPKPSPTQRAMNTLGLASRLQQRLEIEE